MNMNETFYIDGGARGRLRNALIADSDDFAPIMGGGRFQLQTEDQESGKTLVLPFYRIKTDISLGTSAFFFLFIWLLHSFYSLSVILNWSRFE